MTELAAPNAIVRDLFRYPLVRHDGEAQAQKVRRLMGEGAQGAGVGQGDQHA